MNAAVMYDITKTLHLPKFLLFTFKILGITQTGSKFTNIAWCFPFYAIYIYLAIHGWTIFTDFEYTGKNVYAVYIDYLSNSTCLISIVASIVSFYKRKEQIQQFQQKSEEIEKCLHISSRTRTWPNVLILMGIALNGAISVSGLIIDDFVYQMMYYLPTVVYGLDGIFQRQLLQSLEFKYYSINKELNKQAQASVDLSKIFPLTNVQKIERIKAEEKIINVKRMQELAQIHYDLIQMSRSADEMFGLTTLASISLWFASVIDQTYYVVYVSFTGEFVDFSNFFFNILWLVYYIVWIYLEIYSRTKTQYQANKTATYVHDTWNRYAATFETDKNIRHLQVIAIKLLNTRLQFNARGFFPLDWTFLYTVIAAVTTYIVILMQFVM